LRDKSKMRKVEDKLASWEKKKRLKNEISRGNDEFDGERLRGKKVRPKSRLSKEEHNDRRWVWERWQVHKIQLENKILRE